MNILYRSVHEILEYDELRLLTSLGHRVCSLGSYADPRDVPGRMRPGIPEMQYDPEFVRLVAQKGQADVSDQILDSIDVVIVMHDPDFIPRNWSKLRDKRVIWRTIGQSIACTEELLRPCREEGLQIVRYSPAETRIPGYLGADSFIRFAKDPAEYTGWTGDLSRIIGFSHDILQRPGHCSWEVVEQIAGRVPFTLYGRNSDGISFGGGLLSPEEQKKVFQSARAFLSTGTHPASYTLGFIEAWMLGIPVVAVGPIYGSPRRSGYEQDTYEVPDLIDDGVNGFCRDDIGGLIMAFQDLLHDQSLARSIGEAGRKRASELFGVETIREEWRRFLS